MNHSLLLIFSLSFDDRLGTYVPSAYTATMDTQGEPIYIHNKLHEHTLDANGIEKTEGVKALFDLAAALQPEAIQEHFTPTGKKVKLLEKMLESAEVKENIKKYTEAKFDAFLRKASENNVHLGFNLIRKGFIPDTRLKHATQEIAPSMFFRKDETGVYYRLSLLIDGKLKVVKDANINILSNNPAWVSIDNVLFNIPDINGNMLKPFMAQDEVFVAQRFVVDYFKKFILRVAEKNDFEAEGFLMEENKELSRVELKATEDVLSKLGGLSVVYHYGKETFARNDKSKQKTRLHFGENDDISVKRYARNSKQEKEALVKFCDAFGFHPENTMLFHKDIPDYFSLVEWLSANNQKIVDLGFFCQTPSMMAV